MGALPPCNPVDVAFPPSRDHWWPLIDRPILGLSVLLLAGIWMGSRWPVAGLWIVLGLLGGAGGLAARRGWLGKAAVCLGAFACGALLYTYQHRPRPDDLALLAKDGSMAAVEGFVAAELPQTTEARRLVVVARTLEASGQRQPVSGRLLVWAHGAEGPLEGLTVRCEGRVIRAGTSTNPGQFDYWAALARRHIGVILNAESLVPADPAPLQIALRVRRAAAALRRAIVQRIRQSMPGANADLYTGLLAGIVFGLEVAPVPEATAESFRKTGTIHLLVVSGAQVTMIVSAVLFLLRAGRIRWWHGAVAALPLAFFTLMVGMGPSVARAVAMCAIFLIGRIGRADYDPYAALGLAATVICIFESDALFSIGAQLSFAATLGVLVGITSLPRVGWAMNRVARGALVVAAGAAGSWLMVTPLLAYYFSAFPLLGAMANLVTVPLCALVMACAAILMPLSFIGPVAASIPAWAARSLIGSMVTVNELCANLPWAYVSSAHFSALACASWYGVLAVGAFVVRGRWWEGLTPKRLALLGIGLALVLSLWFAITAYRPGELVVTFLDVDHGQCCIVESPSGRTMMVDAGSRYAAQEGQRCARDVILPFLAHRNIDRLDIIVLTHPDADHCNALASIVGEVPVGMVLESFAAPDHKLYSQLAAVAAHRHVTMAPTFAGGHIDLGGGADASVLWPTGTPSDLTFSDNNRSVVLLLRYGETRILLAGDIEQETEAELVKRQAPLQADVLHVPHHGGARSSSEPFLDCVCPRAAVVSCGPGDPDHPHPTTLSRYRDRGVRVLRTDLDGAVAVISDGAEVTVRPHLRGRRAQNRSAASSRARATASSTASGFCSPIASASAGSLSATALSISRASRDLTSRSSSKRLSRSRRMLLSSAAVRLRAADLASDPSSPAAPSALSGRSPTSVRLVSRSLTTTVPAARSPRRFPCLWKNDTAPPTK